MTEGNDVALQPSSQVWQRPAVWLVTGKRTDFGEESGVKDGKNRSKLMEKVCMTVLGGESNEIRLRLRTHGITWAPRPVR